MTSNSILKNSSYVDDDEQNVKSEISSSGTTSTTNGTTTDPPGKDKGCDDLKAKPSKEAERRVSFEPSTKAPSDDSNKKPQRRRQPRPTRSARVGKADPVRDLGILIAILIFFYFVAKGFDGLLSDDNGEMVKEIQMGNGLFRLHKMKETLSSLVVEHTSNHPLRDDCELFLAQSSIPQSGWGVFAGKDISRGAKVLIDESGHQLSFTYEDEKLEHHALPWALLLKHHPTLSNIKPLQRLWDTDDSLGSSFVTTSNIPTGRELLLQWDDHLHSVFPKLFDGIIPTMEDYQEATVLIHEARSTFRDKKRKGQAGTKKTGVIAQALLMVQRVVARYRPAVAALMPITFDSLTNYRGRADDVTALYLGLRNQSVPILLRHGYCLTDVTLKQLPQSTSNDDETKEISFVPVVQKPFKTDQRVHAIPVYFKSIPQTREECSAGGFDCPISNPSGIDPDCFTRFDALVQLCLLDTTKFSFVQSPEEATVKLQWAKVPIHKSDFLKMEAKEIIEKPNILALLEVIALKDLKQDEKVALYFEEDMAQNKLLPTDLLSEYWRIEGAR